MTVSQMNHVNLIGQMSSNPKVVELPNGKKAVRFSISTRETFLDEEGNSKNVKSWHQVTAQGRWAQVMEQLGSKGQAIAIEGRLKSRFFRSRSGEKRTITEVEVNDLVLL
jgi:single-strand DNA-binding protein